MADAVVALGNRLYRIDRPWFSEQAGTPFSLPCAVAVGAEGLVYVLQRGLPHLIVLDSTGRVVDQFQLPEAIDGHGMFCDTNDGSIWIAARDAHSVLQYGGDGELLRRLGDWNCPLPRGPFGHPTGVMVNSRGDIYVTDGYADARVLRFSSAGHLISVWGEPGRGRGQFRTPHALWVTSQDEVLVLDRDNDRLQVFDIDGEWLSEWIDFVRPMDIFVEGNRVYVTEQTPRLSLWNRDGQLVGRCRIPSTSAHGLAGDAEGNIYLAELLQGVVTRLTLIDVS